LPAPVPHAVIVLSANCVTSPDSENQNVSGVLPLFVTVTGWAVLV
jgi:hypothetical protein